jgi:preprotein translocase subunit SecA
LIPGGAPLTTERDNLLQEVQKVRSELERLLDGMDYCFDWKPSDDEWSAREIVYHLVDTPLGGVHTAVRKVLQEDTRELEITAELTNMTPERQERGFGDAKQDLEAVVKGLEEVIASATDAEMEEKKVTLQAITYSRTRDLTAREYVAGIFLRHWREHLEQLSALRDMLGLE